MTQMEFVDMDGYIEKRAGMKIPDIFEKHGEGFFRDLEHEAAVELSQRGGYVVATGGGALTFQRNVDAFKEGGVIVLLDTPLRVLQQLPRAVLSYPPHAPAFEPVLFLPPQEFQWLHLQQLHH